MALPALDLSLSSWFLFELPGPFSRFAASMDKACRNDGGEAKIVAVVDAIQALYKECGEKEPQAEHIRTWGFGLFRATGAHLFDRKSLERSEVRNWTLQGINSADINAKIQATFAAVIRKALLGQIGAFNPESFMDLLGGDFEVVQWDNPSGDEEDGVLIEKSVIVDGLIPKDCWARFLQGLRADPFQLIR